MLKEKAAYYYGELGKNCAEGLLLAANDVYHLNLTQDEILLFAGFGGGMGCGSTCGSLSGAIGVLSRLYGTREDFRAQNLWMYFAGSLAAVPSTALRLPPNIKTKKRAAPPL